MFYSKSTGGFYAREIHDDNIPADAIEITAAQHQALMEGQAAGQRIVPNAAGQPVLSAPPPPTPDELRAALTDAVYAHMNAAAQARGYDDIKAAVTYAEEPTVPKFQQEGQAMRRLRSLVWARCYEILNAAQDGQRSIPTEAELIAEMEALK